MKTKLLSLVVGLMCFSIQTLAQTQKTAHIIGVIPLGSNEYALLQEEATENYYKTAPYPMGELVLNQTVKLQPTDPATGQVQVIANTLTRPLFAQPVKTDAAAPTVLPRFTPVVVTNGILFFQNKKHIAQVYNALTDFTAQGDIDEQLDFFQAEYDGYVSFRTSLINKYNWLKGSLTPTQLAALYAEDFIADEIKKTFLNKNKLVGVGDSVYYFHTINQIYRVAKENRTVLGLFEKLEQEDDPFDPASATFEHMLEVDVMAGSTAGGTRGAVSVDTESEDSCWYVTRLRYRNDFMCDPYSKGFGIHVVEYFKPDGGPIDSMLYWEGGMTMEVDWGDDVTETIDGYDGEFVNHTYPEYGYYNPQTQLTFTDRYGNEQTIRDGTEAEGGFDIEFDVDVACGNTDAIDYEYDNEGGYQIVGRVWINNNILGSHIGSFTHLYKWQADGSLQLEKSTLFTDVKGTFLDRYCDFKTAKYGDKLRKKRRKIQKVKSKVFKYYRYDAIYGIKSRHWFVKSGNFSEINGHVSPCG